MNKETRLISGSKHSAYTLFFMSYIAVLLITISSLFVYYAKISRQVAIETQNTKITLLNQLEQNINNKIQYADILKNELMTDKRLMLLAKGYSIYTYTDIMRDLSSKYMPKYLLNFSVYFADTDMIVTPGVQMKASSFFSIMFRFQNITYEEFAREYLSGYHLKQFAPVQTMEVYKERTADILPYIQSFPPNMDNKPLGQIIFLFDTKEIKELIDEFGSATRSDIYILNENSEAILTSQKAVLPTEEFIKQLDEGPETFRTSINKNTMMVTQKKSEDNSWRYVMVTPQSVYFQENAKFAFSCVAIFLVYLAVGLLIVYFLTKRSYKPVKEIEQLIESRVKDYHNSGKENEYDIIKNTIIGQCNSYQELNKIIEGQMPIVRRDYMLSLVKGLETNYEHIQSRLLSIDIKLESDDFLIAVLEFDMDSQFFMESEESPEKSLSIARFVAQNAGCDLLNNNFLCYFLDLYMVQSIFVLNIKEGNTSDEAVQLVKKLADELIAFVKTNFRLDINIGISMVHYGVKSLPKCFDEAQKALEASKLNELCEAVCFSSLHDLNRDYYYSTETEYQLVNFLKGGRYRQGKELLGNIFDINIASHMTGKEASASLLYEIASTLVRVINSIFIEQKKTPILSENTISELTQNVTLKAARERFMEFIDRIAALSENRSIGKTEKLVNSIADFIEDNVEEVLDLNYLSEKFNVTPQYISNVFKKYKDENIKDYIAKLKLNRAKELLVTTNLSVSEISERLGYANEVGVIRLLKKYEAVTPSVYRQNNKNFF